jgi:hypothetical protein
MTEPMTAAAAAGLGFGQKIAVQGGRLDRRPIFSAVKTPSLSLHLL